MLEDDVDDAELIQQVITRARLDGEFCLEQDRQGFIESLQTFKPDIILSDNLLPQFDATEALEITRQFSMHLPFILVTGTVSEEFAANVIRMGADDYILKDRPARLPTAITAAITRRRSEAAIKQSEEVRQLIMMSALDAIICIDPAGLVMTWNLQAEKLFGWKEEEMIGKRLSETIIPERFREKHEKGLKNFRHSGKGRMLNTVLEVAGLHKSGREFPIELSITLVNQHGNEFFCGFIRDISERKKAEQDILTMNEQLRTLSSHLQRIREEESTRISREIHDQLGQQLTVMKMDASWMTKRVKDVDRAMFERGEGLIKMMDETIKTVRRISEDLRPSLLDEMGLGPAIEYYLQEFGKSYGITTDVKGNFEGLELPDTTRSGLYRVVQEALTNVARHAQAKNVTVTFQKYDDRLVIIVQDDGVGFEIKDAVSKKTLGLLGMRERVAMMGGTYEITSFVGKGTTVSVSVPVQEA